MEKYDVVIIGAGSAGYVAAIRLAELMKDVCIIEEREPGGTCLNRGCIPTKALLKSSEIYGIIKESNNFGIKVDNFSPDFSLVQKRKDTIVQRLVTGVEWLLKKRKVTLKKGRGKILDRGVVEIDGKERIRGESIVIATGSEPAMIPAFNIDRKNVLTSDEGLLLEKPPESLLIVGGGAIGIEFATYFSQFGTKVTIVEQMEKLLPELSDKKITGILQTELEKRGIEIVLGKRIEGVDIRGDGKVVSTLQDGYKDRERKNSC